MKLWLVEIHPDDWSYDEFVVAAVWADSPEQAESTMRAEPRRGENSGSLRDDAAEPWIKPEWRLDVKPAPTSGVALVHWHAG